MYITGEIAMDLGFGAGMDAMMCNGMDEKTQEEKKMKAKCWDDLENMRKENKEWGDMGMFALKYGLGEAALSTFNQAMKKKMQAKITTGAGKEIFEKMAMKKLGPKFAAEMSEKMSRQLAKKAALKATSKMSTKLLMKASCGPLGWALMIFDMATMAVDMIDPLNLQQTVTGKILAEQRSGWIKNSKKMSEQQYQEAIKMYAKEGYGPEFVDKNMYFPYGKELFPTYPEIDEVEKDYADPEVAEKMKKYQLEYIMANIDMSQLEMPPEDEQSDYVKSINGPEDLKLTKEEEEIIQKMHDEYNRMLNEEYQKYVQEMTGFEDEILNKKREEILKLYYQRQRITIMMIGVTVIVLLLMVFILIF